MKGIHQLCARIATVWGTEVTCSKEKTMQKVEMTVATYLELKRKLLGKGFIYGLIVGVGITAIPAIVLILMLGII